MVEQTGFYVSRGDMFVFVSFFHREFQGNMAQRNNVKFMNL